MKRVNIPSGSEFEKTIGFSRAVKVGNLICVSGTAPIAENGETAFVGDLYQQSRRCLEIIKTAIEAAGGELKDVVRTRVYLKDASKWKQAAKAHGEFFTAIRPACTFVEVSRFIEQDWLVEMEADCFLNEDF